MSEYSFVERPFLDQLAALDWQVASATILDYIVVHELAHLICPNHSRRCWNEVDKVLPEFGERKEWLRVHGAGMDL